MFTNSYYINDINKFDDNITTLDIIEKIVNQAYFQEMSFFSAVLRKMMMKKKPKVFCMSHEKISNEILIKKVSLIAVRNREHEITHFENPSIKSMLSNILLKKS
jgi:hypothetical protein